jgi:hypothetical protein
MHVYDMRHRALTLGPELARGGEAAIHPVQGQPHLVAKIYFTPAKGYNQKLTHMVAHPPADPSRGSGHTSIAWPVSLLFDGSGQFVGYLMPRIQNTVTLLTVFTPSLRKQKGLNVDRLFLHRAARNLAVAIRAIHQEGYVVGDINESNILVADTALITIIDTDSFQVQAQGQAQILTFPCPVGKAEYTPPELQGTSLKTVIRQPEHDSFGLGVLIFQLLLEGSHPFRGQWLQSGEPLPLEGKIAQGLFPYAGQAGRGKVAPLPYVSLDILHPRVRDLMLRCFVDGHQNPRQRPTADEWVTALEKAEKALVQCRNGHYYSNHLRACPACRARTEGTKNSLLPAQSTRSISTRAKSLVLGCKNFLAQNIEVFKFCPLVTSLQLYKEVLALQIQTFRLTRIVVSFLQHRVPGRHIGLLFAMVLLLLLLGYSGHSLLTYDSLEWLPGAATAGRIAFHSNRDGNWNVYVMGGDGQKQTRLTENSAPDQAPVWSPDGTRLAFHSNRDGDWNVYVMEADGQEQTRLTTNPANDSEPAWSPDGTRLAFSSDRDGNWNIYVMEADGQEQTRLTDNPANDSGPAWSPDGTRLAFYSYRDGYGTANVYVMEADGQEQTRLTNNPANDSEPAWSPDGTRLAFHSNRDGNWNIYVMEADGQKQTRLTDNPANDSGPAWSPDGTRLTFSSNRDGNWNIYVMRADGQEQTRLTDNPANDRWPIWTP